eukprot:6182422-Pleurochrysis_carterae.AAC.1
MDEGGLRNVLFSREQIYVSSKYSLVMKEWQKAVYRHAGSSSLGKVQLIKFSRDWFQVHAVGKPSANPYGDRAAYITLSAHLWQIQECVFLFQAFTMCVSQRRPKSKT